MVNLSDLEIVSTYNAELRGICNYYNMASNFCKLSYFGHLMEYSCLKTLAAKHKCHISNICDKFRAGQGRWGVLYETRVGVKRCLFAKYIDSKNVKAPSDVKPNLFAQFSCMANSFESRLKAKTCELCGTTEAKHYEIHHVHKLKDLKGKTAVERAMIGRRRKTIVLCEQCHIETHHPSSSNEVSDNGSRVHREV